LGDREKRRNGEGEIGDWVKGSSKLPSKEGLGVG
jgi:hypothetical protein